MTSSEEKKPPPLSPYLFPTLLAMFGAWCFYDGWLNTDPEMMEHALFNQVGSAILIPWAIYDFFKTKKIEKQYKENEKDGASRAVPNENDSES